MQLSRLIVSQPEPPRTLGPFGHDAQPSRTLGIAFDSEPGTRVDRPRHQAPPEVPAQAGSGSPSGEPPGGADLGERRETELADRSRVDVDGLDRGAILTRFGRGALVLVDTLDPGRPGGGVVYRATQASTADAGRAVAL